MPALVVAAGAAAQCDSSPDQPPVFRVVVLSLESLLARPAVVRLRRKLVELRHHSVIRCLVLEFGLHLNRRHAEIATRGYTGPSAQSARRVQCAGRDSEAGRVVLASPLAESIWARVRKIAASSLALASSALRRSAPGRSAPRRPAPRRVVPIRLAPRP